MKSRRLSVPLLAKSKGIKKLLRIMKISVALSFAAVLQLYALDANSQNAKVSIASTNMTLADFIKQVENQTEYLFVYNQDEVNTSSEIKVSGKNKSVKECLDQVARTSDLTYHFENDYIILKKDAAPTSSVVAEKSQATRKVTGVVVDELGEAVIGANVVVKGTTIGVTTDIDGNFTLEAPANASLQVTYIGYLPVTVAVGSKNNLRVVMKEDTQNLEEVVVVGYGVQKKANLSGAVGMVSSKALDNRPVTTVGQALQGTVANLNITPQGGQANSSPTLNVRGATTISNDKGASPLVVIDGIVSDADQLNTLNSADIESISVLKDAASSAIYGSRAAFGVILVTTKKGRSEKLSINYNNNFAFRTLTKMPEIVTDPYTIVQMKNTMSYPWYNLYDEEQIAYAKKRSEDPSISPYFLNPDGQYSYFGNTDWIDEAYKKSSFSTNHTIDLSGTTKKLAYFFSAGYMFQDGMLEQGNDKYNRYNLRSKLDFKITDWWTLSNNTSYVSSDYDKPNYLGDDFYWNVNRTNSLDVPRNPDGTWTEKGGALLGRIADGGRYKTLNNNIMTQFTTQFDIIKDVLMIKGNFALNRKDAQEEGATLPVAYYQGPDLAARYHNEISSAKRATYISDHLLYDVFADFRKNFAEKHFINAMIGFNQEEYRYKKFAASRKDLISNSLPSIGLGSGDMNVEEKKESWALRGMFFRLNYIYDDKYIAEFNGRYDGTSRFPKHDRFAFNPSGSLAWIVSKEDFFEPLTDVVSYFKLRGSYGNLGNQDVGAYDYIALMEAKRASQILDGKQPVYVGAPGLVAGNLTWEKVSVANFGIDMNFLDNKLTASGDVYRRDTRDMLTKGRTLPSVIGTKEPKENAADLKTRGWEITLGWRDAFQVSGKPFNYGVNFMLSDSRAWITKFDNPTGTLKDHYVGKELGEIWGMNTLGYFTSDEDVKNHADQSLVTSYPGTRPLAAGDLKFEDRNGDGKITWGEWTNENAGDYYIIGNTSSRFNYSFSLDADWNGFDFRAFFQGVGKKDYMPGPGDLYFWGIYSQPWTNVTKGNMDHWTPETPDAYFPRPKAYVAEQTDKECGVAQTKYLQNAAYLRLKNLTVGYTLPQSLTQKFLVSRLRVFFTGENLFTISALDDHYKIDPEGLGGGMYPLQRSYSFGLNVSF